MILVDVKKTINFYAATVDGEQLTAEHTLSLLRHSWICQCARCSACKIGLAISRAEGKGDASDGSNIV